MSSTPQTMRCWRDGKWQADELANLAARLESELKELQEACAETPTKAELLDQNRRLKFRISVLEDRDEMARQLVKLEKEVERHQPELCDEIRMERDQLKELVNR